MDRKRKILLAALALSLAACLVLPAHYARADGDRELVFGMSAAFTGANGELGMEFYRGMMAYIDHFNAAGGANGWTIRIVPANDGYNPAPCFQNTARFIRRDNVFALCSYVGTPTTTCILPLLQKFQDRNIYLLFPFTGAQPLRTEPFGRYVYNLRASYFDETTGLVDRLLSIGLSRIGVFYQSDAYGRTGWDGVKRALSRYGLKIVAEAAYRRGASFDQDFTREALHLLERDVDAVITVGTYASQGAFIRDARRVGFDGPVAGLSFSDSDKMLDLLVEQGRKDGRDYTANLIHTQVVPSYADLTFPGVRLYRKIMGDYEGVPMTQAEGGKPRRFSYVSFEGFLNGVLLGEMVRRMGDQPLRERIPEIMASMRNFDLGIGHRVDFGSRRHQGLNAVYFTTVSGGSFNTFTDWERWRK
ncbi:MAG: ABC transporter substrate-binding protein [Desulfovibrionaceae bacterium]|nr:ABC transporter substrate-binding protein [Desulfovibrionaceae bacterium]